MACLPGWLMLLCRQRKGGKSCPKLRVPTLSWHARAVCPVPKQPGCCRGSVVPGHGPPPAASLPAASACFVCPARRRCCSLGCGLFRVLPCSGSCQGSSWHRGNEQEQILTARETSAVWQRWGAAWCSACWGCCSQRARGSSGGEQEAPECAGAGPVSPVRDDALGPLHHSEKSFGMAPSGAVALCFQKAESEIGQRCCRCCQLGCQGLTRGVCAG